MSRRRTAGWSVDDAIEECEMHVRHMHLIIKGIEGSKKADAELRRTMNYALTTMRDRKRNLMHVQAILDRSTEGK